MALEARAWVRAGFSLDEITNRYLDLYAEVLDLRRALGARKSP
jgi:hypothetical protein